MQLDAVMASPPFDLTFTDDVRRECLAFVDRSSERPLTVALMKARSTITKTGRRIEDPVERWYFAGYGAQQLKDLEAAYTERGVPLLHEICGFVIAIPQPHLLSELKGRTLARDSTGLALVDRNDGI